MYYKNKYSIITMVAIIHCIITDLVNNLIRKKILIWQSKKNISKNHKLILEKIKIFKYFTPKVSLYLYHLKKIKKNGYCWGRNW